MRYVVTGRVLQPRVATYIAAFILATLPQSSLAMQVEQHGDGGWLLPETFLPDPGRSYTYQVTYPDGDSGPVTVVPAYDEKSGALSCHTTIWSELYQESVETVNEYRYLPDGIYFIESMGSGLPELWLPNPITAGLSWQTESSDYRVGKLAVPCPVKLLAGPSCLQLFSRPHLMPDIEIESYFAEGYGKVLARVRSSGAVEHILIKTELLPPPLPQSHRQQ